jgi:hypothetical protein
MRLYEHEGTIYNLDQLVSLSEGTGTGAEAWEGKGEEKPLIILRFSGCRDSVELPSKERPMIEKLLRKKLTG